VSFDIRNAISFHSVAFHSCKLKSINVAVSFYVQSVLLIRKFATAKTASGLFRGTNELRIDRSE